MLKKEQNIDIIGSHGRGYRIDDLSRTHLYDLMNHSAEMPSTPPQQSASSWLSSLSL